MRVVYARRRLAAYAENPRKLTTLVANPAEARRVSSDLQTVLGDKGSPEKYPPAVRLLIVAAGAGLGWGVVTLIGFAVARVASLYLGGPQ